MSWNSILQRREGEEEEFMGREMGLSVARRENGHIRIEEEFFEHENFCSTNTTHLRIKGWVFRNVSFLAVRRTDIKQTSFLLRRK